MANHQLLLVVLLPENGDVRLDKCEQACNHCRYAVEVAGPRRAAEIPGQPGHGYHGGLVDTEGIDGVDIGRKQYVGLEFPEALRIELQGARVLFEVLTLAKLRGIHEHGHDDTFGMLAGKFYQAEVAGMQIAHGRYDGDMLPMVAPTFVQLA